MYGYVPWVHAVGQHPVQTSQTTRRAAQQKGVTEKLARTASSQSRIASRSLVANYSIIYRTFCVSVLWMGQACLNALNRLSVQCAENPTAFYQRVT